MSTNAKPPQPKKDKSLREQMGLWDSFEISLLSSAMKLTLGTLFILISWHFYSKYVTPPIMPNIDLEEWWGPYPVDMELDKFIQPYTVEFPDVVVNDLNERLLHRRPFTPPLENTGSKYGVNTGLITRVLDFWQNSYNVEERVRFLNKYNHYITQIQGLNIHYVHVKPKAPANVAVVPILLIHSWPSSVREFYELIPVLTTHQADRDFVFEVIVPSLPGFGFSQAPQREGINGIKISVILHNLMQRIGHEKYYIHGGDFGQDIGTIMATVFPNNVLGFHSSAPVADYCSTSSIFNVFHFYFSPLFDSAAHFDFFPTIKRVRVFSERQGYILQQLVKPDTYGIALTESPAGLAAYIIEKFSSWHSVENEKSYDGGLMKKYSLTHVLDNVMIYWMTNSIGSSLRTFHECSLALSDVHEIPTDVPTWGIKFKNQYVTSDSVLRTKYKNYLQSSEVNDIGHLPAMEHTTLLAIDIFKAVTAFRQFHGHKKESQPPLDNPTPEVTKTFTHEANNNPEETKKNSASEENKTPAPEVNNPPTSEVKETVYNFKVKDIKGNEVSLETYRGKVLIIVNVASHCGYTNTHYTQLNELYEKYAQKGLRILAFPCNQFGGQEPGTLSEILQFTQKRNVKFDVFEKVDVNGENTHPLWEFLKRVQGGTLGDFIKWNFSKFIIDRNGIPVERFGPNVDPVDLEPYLTKYL